MIFIRHPRPDIAHGICYGQLDIDIHDEGHEQIRQALKLVPRARRILASPARRCRKLALKLAQRDGVEPDFDPRLWEMNMGDWEGIPWRDIPRDVSDLWLRDPYNLPCPNGESFAELQQRVLDSIGPYGNELRDTVVVCHAGPIRAVQMAWQGLTFKEAFSMAPPYAQPLKIRPSRQSEQDRDYQRRSQ